MVGGLDENNEEMSSISEKRFQDVRDGEISGKPELKRKVKHRGVELDENEELSWFDP